MLYLNDIFQVFGHQELVIFEYVCSVRILAGVSCMNICLLSRRFKDFGSSCSDGIIITIVQCSIF